MSLVDETIELLRRCQIVPEAVVTQLCSKARELLVEESNVQLVDTPVTICGDIHGQLHDLLTLFAHAGECPYTNYLFLGDFVDRGYYSLESFLLLLCLKIRYPDRITLIRGNHETRQITMTYGFYEECQRKYGTSAVWRMCCDVFDYLALAALVGGPGGVFCVHGGLSPQVRRIDDIKAIDRKQEVPHQGPMCDLLWSDPADSGLDEDGEDTVMANSNNDGLGANGNSGSSSKAKAKVEWPPPSDYTAWGVSTRGAGYTFGAAPVHAFNYMNDTTLIARAHQLVMEGYKEMFDGELVTVWSAPNYCYRCGNIAAVLTIHDDLTRQYTTFVTEGTQMVPTKRPVPEYFL